MIWIVCRFVSLSARKIILFFEIWSICLLHDLWWFKVKCKSIFNILFRTWMICYLSFCVKSLHWLHGNFYRLHGFMALIYSWQAWFMILCSTELSILWRLISKSWPVRLLSFVEFLRSHQRTIQIWIKCSVRSCSGIVFLGHIWGVI